MSLFTKFEQLKTERPYFARSLQLSAIIMAILLLALGINFVFSKYAESQNNTLTLSAGSTSNIKITYYENNPSYTGSNERTHIDSKTESVDYTIKSISEITENFRAPDQCVFSGWALTRTYNPEVDPRRYMPGEIYSEDVNLDVYAIWGKIGQYTLYFGANGGYYEDAEMIGGLDDAFNQICPANMEYQSEDENTTYSTCEMIYPGEQIGSCTIDQLQFICDSGAGQYGLSGNKVRIYLKSVPKGYDFQDKTNWVDIDETADLYYKNDNITLSKAGTETYKLSKKFEFIDHDDNGYYDLAIVFSRDSSDTYFDSASDCAWYSGCSEHTSNQIIVTYPDPTISNYFSPHYLYQHKTSTYGLPLLDVPLPAMIVHRTDAVNSLRYTKVSAGPTYYTNLYIDDSRTKTEDSSRGIAMIPTPFPNQTEQNNFLGYYTAKEGGELVIAYDKNTKKFTVQPNVAGYTNNNCEWILTQDMAVYAHWGNTNLLDDIIEFFTPDNSNSELLLAAIKEQFIFML